MRSIDLNADLGEERGDDAALLGVVTTASVAAGGHAGGGAVLEEIVRLAAEAAVAVGAHPSYPDRPSFGRVSRAGEHDARAIAEFVRAQVMSVAAACSSRSVGMAHVKAHGALYNDAAVDGGVAEAYLDGVRAAGRELGEPMLPVVAPYGSATHDACDRLGIPFRAEAFADRGYAPDGSLVPRGQPGALLLDDDAVIAQVRSIVMDGVVTSIDGTTVALPAVTVCLHGDTPGAVRMARAVRADLERLGVFIRPLVP